MTDASGPVSEEFLERQYLTDIESLPQLSSDDIRTAVDVMVAGDLARQRLMQSQLAAVVTIARELREATGSAVPLLDIIQQGNTALVLATNEVRVTDDFPALADVRIREAVQQFLDS